jgi:N-acetylmuramoyl-L-alanine amidase
VRARQRRNRWVLLTLATLAAAGTLGWVLLNGGASHGPGRAAGGARDASAALKSASASATGDADFRSGLESQATTGATVSVVPGTKANEPASPPTPTGGLREESKGDGAVPAPRIVWKPIPYLHRRRQEMAAYDERHYGLHTWRLQDPKVIVEHYTAAPTFTSTYSYFSTDTADPELHELPGVCAHFVIDTDGTIYQLVHLDTQCRHTVGLNYTAIGIEHVGESDAEILSNPRQLNASLALTLWLMARYHIKLGNVIGHNESLTSPFHHELVPSLRCQTHGDWTRSDMNVYRRQLAKLARTHGLVVHSRDKIGSSSCS